MKSFLFPVLFLFTVLIGNAQIIDIPDANFKDALVNHNTGLFVPYPTSNGVYNYSEVDTNGDGEIQLTEAEAIYALNLDDFDIVSLEGIEHFINLEYLNCEDNMLTSLDVSNNIQIETLSCRSNQLISLNVQNCSNLQVLSCRNNELSNLDLSQNTNLEYLDCRVNQIADLDLSNNINLVNVSCGENQMINIDVSNCINLDYLYCGENELQELNVDDNINLNYLATVYNNITNLDLSNNAYIETLYVYNNPLETLNIKNGSTTEFSNNLNLNIPTLEFICVDDNEIELVQNIVNTNVVINSYCSFVPGGDYYTVEGVNKLDANLNGCDVDDNLYSSLKFSISNGTNSGMYICDTTGNYSIPVLEGSHTFIPILENPDYFIASPNPVTVSFPSETSPYNQDFCITPNGVHNDLEVFVIPITNAAPGFDSEYKIIYRNTGNTLLSGNIEFNYSFDIDYIEYLSSIPSETSNMNNILSWDYLDLAPFETREILVTFNLNTPTDVDFPLNSGDELNFEVTIYPIQDDETPDNNDFGLKQIVVNSFDPNDIRCLEGETIAPERVGEYVHYLIRFENLGTANAINIVVKNAIDDVKFDINTLVSLDGSHNYYTRINAQNDVEFVFENINLPFDDATNDAYVLYKIRTIGSLVLGDEFSNQAEIYFDFNAPIITNTYVTEIAEDNLSVLDNNLVTTRIFPNPVNDILTIESETILISATILDINGRAILNSQFEDTGYQIDLSALKSGIYFLKVFSSSGNQTLKVVKK